MVSKFNFLGKLVELEHSVRISFSIYVCCWSFTPIKFQYFLLYITTNIPIGYSRKKNAILRISPTIFHSSTIVWGKQTFTEDKKWMGTNLATGKFNIQKKYIVISNSPYAKIYLPLVFLELHSQNKL